MEDVAILAVFHSVSAELAARKESQGSGAVSDAIAESTIQAM